MWYLVFTAKCRFNEIKTANCVTVLSQPDAVLCVCCLLSVVCCLLSVVCCLLSVVCCLLSVVCCLLETYLTIFVVSSICETWKSKIPTKKNTTIDFCFTKIDIIISVHDSAVALWIIWHRYSSTEVFVRNMTEPWRVKRKKLMVVEFLILYPFVILQLLRKFLIKSWRQLTTFFSAVL